MIRAGQAQRQTRFNRFLLPSLFVPVPPETVKIKIIPPELKPGIEATMICDSSSSNPPATISWWRDGIAVDGKCCWPDTLGMGMPLRGWGYLLNCCKIVGRSFLYRLFYGLCFFLFVCCFYRPCYTGMNNSSKPGLWGGTVSSLELKVNISQDMDGNVYTCQSANEALQRNVHEAIKLQVLCTCLRASRKRLTDPL